MELSVDLKGATRDVVLFRFGNSLHPLEDSWSHAGIPDIALLCDKMLAWGHPKARGGVLSHDADVTYKHVQDTEDTARAVFDLLVQFHDKLGGAGQSASWNSISLAVHQFAVASTKTEKENWFKGDPTVPYSSYRPCFLNGTSVPDGVDYQCQRHSVVSQSVSAAGLAPPVNEAEKFFREFLQQWLVTQNLDAVSDLVDQAAMTSQFKLLEGNSPALPQNMLLVWLSADHGIANETAHGTSVTFAAQMRGQLEKSRTKFPDLLSALRVDGTEPAYVFAPVPREAGVLADYVAVFRLRTAPRDVISIGVARRGGTYKVVSFEWVAF